MSRPSETPGLEGDDITPACRSIESCFESCWKSVLPEYRLDTRVATFDTYGRTGASPSVLVLGLRDRDSRLDSTVIEGDGDPERSCVLSSERRSSSPSSSWDSGRGQLWVFSSSCCLALGTRRNPQKRACAMTEKAQKILRVMNCAWAGAVVKLFAVIPAVVPAARRR